MLTQIAISMDSSQTGLIDRHVQTLIGQYLPPISTAGKAVSMIDRSRMISEGNIPRDTLTSTQVTSTLKMMMYM